MGDDPIRQRLVVSGRVQGVGFRRYVERAAHRHGVAGWVKNRPDGGVEILVEGPRTALDGLTADVRRGPPGAHVLDIQASAAAGDEPLPRPFAIHRG